MPPTSLSSGDTPAFARENARRGEDEDIDVFSPPAQEVSSPSLGSAPNALQTWIAQASEAPPPTVPDLPNAGPALSDQTLRRLMRAKHYTLSQPDPRLAAEATSRAFSYQPEPDPQELESLASASLAGSQRSRRRRRKQSNAGQSRSRHNSRPSIPPTEPSQSADPSRTLGSLELPASPQSGGDSNLKLSPVPNKEERPLLSSLARKKGASFSLAPPTQRWVVPIKNWARWMARMELGFYILPCILLGSLAIKFALGLWGWSGQATPPKYGDFEAQRHWIELTLHKPYSEWYFYDLEWWGLDYPPLTAWVSLWFGKLALYSPSVAPHFALDTSRGDEAEPLVAFMRFSVVLCEVLVYAPAVIFFVYCRRLRDRPSPPLTTPALGNGRRLGPLESNVVIKGISIAAILTQPALLLIDHGHFQYNNVMLGLVAWTFGLLYSFLPNHATSTTFFDSAGTAVDVSQGNESATFRSMYTRKISYQYVVAAVAFTLALLFKQMALFFAPAVFAIMLGRCVGLYRNVGFDPAFALFCGLGIAVVLPTLCSLSPWILAGDVAGLLQIVHRVFPVARGIFEDKVANVWCFLSVFPFLPHSLRVKNLFTPAALARTAAGTTLVLILPTCAVLFLASLLTVKIETEMDTQAVEAVTNPAPPRSRYAASLGQRSVRSRASKRAMGLASIVGSVGGEREGSIEPSLAPSLAGRGGQKPRQAASAISTSARILPRSSPLEEGDLGQWSLAPPVEIVSSSPSPVAAVLPWAMGHVALTCFLFGFQVHEKTILLPLLPVILTLTAPDDTWAAGGAANEAEWVLLINNMAVFSMYPLLERDGLKFPYALLLVGWNWMLGLSPRTFLRRCLALAHDLGLTPRREGVRTEITLTWAQRFSTVAHAGIIAVHGASIFLPLFGSIFCRQLTMRIAERYPDLEAVAMVVLATPVFGTVWLVLLWKTLTVAASAGVHMPYLNPAPVARAPRDT